MSNNTTSAALEAESTSLAEYTYTEYNNTLPNSSDLYPTVDYNITDAVAVLNTTISMTTMVTDKVVTPVMTTSTETFTTETSSVRHMPLDLEVLETTAAPTTLHDTSTVAMTTVLASQSTTDVERTQSGIPVTVIWVPYFIFSLVLLVLMIVSFVRFHAKNGHKYRQRRAEFWRQLNMQSLLEQIPGGGASPPNGGVPVASSSSAPPKRGPDKTKSKPTASKGKPRKSRRPLVFTSNLNGSMVDVRCGERESLRTFHARTKPNQNPSSAWSLPQKKSSLFTSGRPNLVPEDDEVFLLQQTRL